MRTNGLQFPNFFFNYYQASDSLFGLLVLITSTVIFGYYTFWVIVMVNISIRVLGVIID
jgi:hypothetical protein